MAQPGTTPIAAPIDTTAIGDTYATHFEQRGQGGFRSVANTTERDAISVGRRKSGMLVFCIADGVTYQLAPNLTTWNTYTVAGILPADVMLKSVYDPNDDGIVTNSDQLQSQNGAYYRDRANHTGTQAQSTVTNLVSDLALKETISLIGTNGHAAGPLSGGLIPLAQLPPGTPNLYKGLYDASTNLPAIINGTGTAGEFYIANVIGNAYAPVNVTIVNQIVAYDGAVWQVGAVFSGGIASLTTNAGVQTGPAVTLNNTSYLVDSAGKRFVTDNIQAGLNASPNPVTAANPVATQADLTSLIVVGNGVFMAELFNDGQTLGDGTLRTLASLGYNNTTAGNYWTRVNSAYTINVNTMSIDWIARQEAYLAMEQDGYSKIISPGGRGYCPSQTWDLPRTQLGFSFYRRGLSYEFDDQGSATRNRTGNNFILYKRMPVDQAEAAGAFLDYSFRFKNMYLAGNNAENANNIGIQLGASCHSVFENIETNTFQRGIDCQFALELSLFNVKHVNYFEYGSKIGKGEWVGATSSTAGCNLVNIVQHRCVVGSGTTPEAGLYFYGAPGLVYGNNLTFEGNNGAVHHVYYDNDSLDFDAGATQSVSLNNLYFETAGASRAAIRFKSLKGDFYVSKWIDIVSDANMPVFLEAEQPVNTIGVRQLYINVSGYATSQDTKKWRATCPYSRVAQGSIFESGYCSYFDVSRVNMPNGSGQFNTITNFDTSLPNYVIPKSSQFTYVPSPI